MQEEGLTLIHRFTHIIARHLYSSPWQKVGIGYSHGPYHDQWVYDVGKEVGKEHGQVHQHENPHANKKGRLLSKFDYDKLP